MKSRWLAALFALLTLGTHAYLSIQNYQLKLGTGSKSLCNLNATFNCDAVALSRYAELFGIPMAVWGASFNLVLLIFLLIGALSLAEPRSRVDRMAWVLAGISVVTSVVMGFISMSSLGTYCLFCIATYIFSILILVFIHRFRETDGNFAEDFRALFGQSKGLLVLLVAFPALAFLFNAMALKEFGFEQNKWRVTESINLWKAAPDQSFDSILGIPYKEPNAAQNIVLVEFADFLCPHCKTAAGPLHAFADSHPNVQLIFIPFPLDGSCNPAIPQKGDGLRCNLAAAALCGQKLAGQGFKAHDFIFSKQEEISLSNYPREISNLAEKLNLNIEALKVCIDSTEIKDLIQKGAEAGQKAKIPGTPAIFANGKKLESGQYYPVLESLAEVVRNSK